jgi:hypothetical protein
MAASTLLMRLLGGGGQGARRKERAKALLKHMYYNRRAIRLALLALVCFLGLVATWRISSSSSSSTSLLESADYDAAPASLARVGVGARKGARRTEAVAAEAEAEAAKGPSGAVEEEEEEGDDDEVLLDAGWQADDDDDDKGGGEEEAAGQGGWGAEDDEEEEEEEEQAAGPKGEVKAAAGAAAPGKEAPPAAGAAAVPELHLDPETERRRNHCMAEYGQRRYLEEEEEADRVPPILYSYPGKKTEGPGVRVCVIREHACMFGLWWRLWRTHTHTRLAVTLLAYTPNTPNTRTTPTPKCRERQHVGAAADRLRYGGVHGLHPR